MAPTPARQLPLQTNTHTVYELQSQVTELALDTVPLDSGSINQPDLFARPPPSPESARTFRSRCRRLFRRQPPGKLPPAIIEPQVLGPLPPYTPAIPLHAPTLTVTDLSTPAAASSTIPPTISSASPVISTDHSRFVVVAVLLGIALLAVIAGAAHVMLKRRGGRVAFTIPTLSRKNENAGRSSKNENAGRRAKGDQGIRGGGGLQKGKGGIAHDDSMWGTRGKMWKTSSKMLRTPVKMVGASVKMLRTSVKEKMILLISQRSPSPKDGLDLDWVVVQGLAPAPVYQPSKPVPASTRGMEQDHEQRYTKPDLETGDVAMPAFASRASLGEGGPHLCTITEMEEQDLGDVPMHIRHSDGYDSFSELDSKEVADIAHALGLALQNYSSSVSTLDSNPAARRRSMCVHPEDTVLAAMALRSGTETVALRARAASPPRKISMASMLTTGSHEAVIFSPLSSGLSVATSFSTYESEEAAESEVIIDSDDELLFEVRRAQPRSMEFGRGLVVSIGSVSDLKDTQQNRQDTVPRLVVSASTSSESGTRYILGPHTAKYEGGGGGSNGFLSVSTCSSDTSMSLADFPSPPVILDAVKRISTSLTSEIERSLNMTLASNAHLNSNMSKLQPTQSSIVDLTVCEQRMMAEVKRRLQERSRNRDRVEPDSDFMYIL
ncbi:hypothetical protein EWM64_g312 [Hericium alpestre]|uniref:Uncharacterized protein n=1 Tax=Hericium alpestre TaxID=135208 RepID=A0A4Z0A9E1_9AGAM|nr:hypothetical protein EWM64_g312 [Hericium alpestre]